MPDAIFAVVLDVILSLLCGLIGLMGAGLVGYYVLRLLGVPAANGRAARLATVVFGVPAALFGLYYGYHIGVNLLRV